MKKIFLFLGIVLFSLVGVSAQKSKSYDDMWEEVNNFRQKALPKSAIEVVDKIYEKAKKENNIGEILKSTSYQIMLMQDFEENHFVAAIAKLDAEIEPADEPLKQVLYSMKARVLWFYYSQNRYRFLDRSTTVDFDNNDISTWSLQKIVEETFENYKLSLQNENILKKEPIHLLHQVLNNSGEGREFRPTLYDFLAHRALEFFKSTEPGIVKPAETFYINDESYISDAQSFVNLKIETPDTLSTKYYALNILQNLVDFHIKDSDPAAFLNVEVERLKFVRDNAIFAHADSLYLQQLLNLKEKYKTHKSSSILYYEIAQFYYDESDYYEHVLASQLKDYKQKALAYFEELISKFPNTNHAKNAKYYKFILEKPDFRITVEKPNIPNKPFLISANYKNIEKLHFRLLNFGPSEKKIFTNKYTEQYILELKKLKPIRTWSVELPKDKDYNYHNIELPVEGLDLGTYLIFACSSEDFDVEKDVFAHSELVFSNLAYMSRSLIDGSMEVNVRDRESGGAIEGVQVEAYTSEYNYRTRAYETRRVGKEYTDEDGSVIFKAPNSKEYSRSLSFVLKNGKDIIDDNRYFYQRYQDTIPKESRKLSIFTDRAIYRPGQSVYFKGIFYKTVGKDSEVIEGQNIVLKLVDANYQQIDSLVLKTNEYGSVQGSFVLPTGGLNGRVSLQSTYGSNTFMVEEYKRPKFEVTMENLTESYRLDEDVKVRGQAKAYAGSAIDGAAVKYRIVRRASYPWWRWWWGDMPNTYPMEIAHGTVQTDEEGKFEIDFKAIPDYTQKREHQPMFSYEISVDVTDISGETRSAHTIVQVGYVSMFVSTNIPNQIDQAEKSKKYNIRTTNLNGVKQDGNVNVKIHRLRQTKNFLHHKFWERPDKFILTKEEFKELFPNYIYDNENDINTWDKLEKVYEKTFNTKHDTIIEFKDISNWLVGDYIIDIEGVDNYGEKFQSSRFLNISNSKKKDISIISALNIQSLSKTYEVGDEVLIHLSSALNDAEIMMEYEKDGRIFHREWIKLNREQKTIKVPVTAAELGDFRVNFDMFNKGRYYTKTEFVQVPDNSKNLDVSFETFRDKLSPGQEEEWRIKIRGSKGEKLAAEFLAGMYDKSLDAFAHHGWYLTPFFNFFHSASWRNTNHTLGVTSTRYAKSHYSQGLSHQIYESMSFFDGIFGKYGYFDQNVARRKASGMAAPTSTLVMDSREEVVFGGAADFEEEAEGSDFGIEEEKIVGVAKPIDPNSYTQEEGVKIRSNFNETAFFMPQLSTNKDGDVVLKFTMPESLTRWKMMGLAHTKDMKIGTIREELVTQKELMVFPNAPRFFRQGDKMIFSVKISNLSENDIAGKCSIEFIDASTQKSINSLMEVKNLEKDFSCQKGQSTVVEWEAQIPNDVGAITYRVVAKAGKFSDGEENTLPVLTERMLVTESMPLPINGNESKTFVFDKILNNKSESLSHFKYTLEFTSNPAWYAVQALPYIMESRYDNAEQIFSRIYANSIAAHIANSSPKIKEVFESWKNLSPDALLSNLEKNPELKSLMIEETPWLMEAKNESERKQRIGVLFDLVQMSSKLDENIRKLEKLQVSNGAWPWFKGMPDNRYITQHIVSGFGKLNHLGILDLKKDRRSRNMITRALRYVDDRITDDYNNLIKFKIDLDKNNLNNTQIQYLYARSFFNQEFSISSKNKKAYDYYLSQTNEYWTAYGHYSQAMMALILYRSGFKATPKNILKSLKERSVSDDEMGVYWQKLGRGYYWYEAPIEAQAMLIEAFEEVGKDDAMVEKMKVWLLKQKQTQNWGNTKATADAVYALILRGTDLLADDKLVEIKVGNKNIDPDKYADTPAEKGTGYFKTSWSADEIVPEMGKIELNKSTKGVAWGAVYWQYFEKLDKITPAETPLSIKKELFVVERSPRGDVIRPISKTNKVKIGDRVRVRVEIRVDRDLEYVHMKDMRAAGFEPVNVLSGYRYQDGLGYYESTQDAATNFFMDYLRKGTYVFEYDLLANQKGEFSNGITTIQCMYAPEFTSHSQGIRVRVD